MNGATKQNRRPRSPRGEQWSTHLNHNAHRTATKLPKPKPAKLSSAGEALFAVAVQHHQTGRLEQAENLYRQVLGTNPRHPDSLHLLGVLALQVGRHDIAVDLIGRAIGIDATVALYHTNLGNALRALGRLEPAITCYRRAIVLRPRYSEACNNLGVALHSQGQVTSHPRSEVASDAQTPVASDARTQRTSLGQEQMDEAATWLRKAIALRPDFPEAHNNLGNLLADLGRPDQAAECYRQAIRLRPAYAEAHNNLAAALKDLGALDQAIVSYQTAVTLQPNLPEAHHNLGIVLKRLDRLDEAMVCSRTAIALRPDMPEAYDNLGSALADQGKLDDAVACYRKAIALRPDDPLVHDNLGTVLKEQGSTDEAIACFRAAIDLRPKFPNAHHNLAMTLLARGDMEAGWAEYEWRWQTAAEGTVPPRLQPAAMARRGRRTTFAADPRRAGVRRHAAILPLRRAGGRSRMARGLGGATAAGPADG